MVFSAPYTFPQSNRREGVGVRPRAPGQPVVLERDSHSLSLAGLFIMMLDTTILKNNFKMLKEENQ